MPKRKSIITPEWARRIEQLRHRLKISQGELARRMQCSAMTISRWERGLLAPSADYYVQLGKLAGKADCWFFWEHAGIQIADVVRALPSKFLGKLPASNLESTSAGIGGKRELSGRGNTVPVPMRRGVAGTHGHGGDKHYSLDGMPARGLVGAPSDWVPNPTYTSMLRVRGHSMEPLLHDGDILAVDSFQTDRETLDGKIVVVSNEEKGLSVSRFRRYQNLQVLESYNQEYQPVVLDKKNNFRILGRVLWWISAAP
jgi:phage repressor protein C with HTH and peptisase S24 domain